MKQAISLFAVLLILVGCAQLGLQPAEKFEEKLAYAYGVHTAVLDSTKASLTAPKPTVTSAEATQVLKLADESRVILDASRVAFKAGDISTAEGKLLLATTILTQLQTYLRSKQ